MYTSVLVLHSWLRWLVLAAGIAAIVTGVALARGRGNPARAWKAARAFVIAMDLQLVLGLLLYGFLSPITQAAFSNMKAAMKDAQVRFFAVEHIALMVVAVALAHVGKTRGRLAGSDPARGKTMAIWFGLALVVVLISIPWPGRVMGRPLFRF